MRGRFTLVRLAVVALLLVVVIGPAAAQSDLVASLEVLNAGVEVRRVDTVNWVPVKVETLIGPGDSVRTNGTGRVRITFFSDGTSVEIEPRSEYRLVEFTGDEQSFRLTVEVLIGITRQQFARLVAPESSYRVITPGAEMTVRGTDFAVRVEETGVLRC